VGEHATRGAVYAESCLYVARRVKKGSLQSCAGMDMVGPEVNPDVDR
jgi:hypothetical protein